MAHRIIEKQLFVGFTEKQLDIIETYKIGETVNGKYMDEAVTIVYELMEKNGLKSIVVPIVNKNGVHNLSIQKI